MGNLTRTALCCLLLAVGATALRCNVGSVSIVNGQLERQNGKIETCDKVCTLRKVFIEQDNHLLTIMGCEDEKSAVLADIACQTDLCNAHELVGPFAEDINVDPVAPTRTCYVGVSMGKTFSVGGGERCDSGICGSATSLVSGYPTTAYFCSTWELCYAGNNGTSDPGFLNKCSPLTDKTSFCCCDYPNYCNSKNSTIPNPTPTPADMSKRIPVACYAGIQITTNNVTTTLDGRYIACQGDCASVSYAAGAMTTVTVYQCDPTSVCPGLGLLNDCMSVDNGTFSGCCCNTDACIDPTRNRKPQGNNHMLECEVGLHLGNSTNIGGRAGCDGMCSRVKTSIAGVDVGLYHCASRALCNYLDAVNTEVPLPLTTVQATGYCCEYPDNCNAIGQNVNFTRHERGERLEIACYEGLYFDGQPLGNTGRFRVCNGDCASMTLNTTIGSAAHNLTLYTCDPATVCRQLGITNGCASVSSGLVSGCCCSDDVCIDPRHNKMPNGQGLQCMVGFEIGKTVHGGSMPCTGYCAEVSTHVIFGTQDTPVTAYFCAPKTLCQTFDVVDSTTVYPLDRAVRIGCCSRFNNCNARHFNSTPTVEPQTQDPITCYSGLGVAYGGGPSKLLSDPNSYVGCRGDCGAVSFTSNNYTFTVYTCDPVDVCTAFGVNMNNCKDMDVLSGCCCNFNDCLNLTTRSVKPVPPPAIPNEMQCFVGVSLKNSSFAGSPLVLGASMTCNGECSSVQTTTLGTMITTAYFCAPRPVCSALQITDTCTAMFTQPPVKACCCYLDNCNIINQYPGLQLPTTAPATVAPGSKPILCYSGIALGGSSLGGRYMACNGKCGALSLYTSLGNTSFTATVFSCDPVSLCDQVGINNNCKSHLLGESLTGCCCDFDDCIDQTHVSVKNAPIVIPDNLKCFVGVSLKNGSAAGNPLTLGSAMPCNGECASIQTVTMGSVTTIVYFCVAKPVCDALQIANTCMVEFTTPPVQACCCVSDNCNFLGKYPNIPVPTAAPAPTGSKPILCYSGIALGGNSLGGRYMACNGKCGALSLYTSLGNTSFTATVFSCDPVSLCDQIGINNNCKSHLLGESLTGCCCDFDDCIDQTHVSVKNPPVVIPDKLQCFVGVSLKNGSAAGNPLTFGSAMSCNGQCASVQTVTMGSVTTIVYFCVATPVCAGLNITNTCMVAFTTPAIQACCCYSDNCNFISKYPNTPLPTAAPAPTGNKPILCYSGISINGTSLGGRYMACSGKCGALSLFTQLSNTSVTATVYSCDPVSLCEQVGINNNCKKNLLGEALTGCCCDFDDCIDLDKIIIKPAPVVIPDSLQCFVGLRIKNESIPNTQGTLLGSSMPCTGECAKVNTTLGGITTEGFFCAPQSLCNGLGIPNGCRQLPGDEQMFTGCCCASDNCNAQGLTLPPTVAPKAQTPITCYTGIALDGNPLSSDKYMACNGDCAQITISSKFANQTVQATLFTCDPVSLCDSFKLKDNCGKIQGLVTGCCCSWNDCIDTKALNVKTTPAPPGQNTKSSFSLSTVFIYAVASIALLFRQ